MDDLTNTFGMGLGRPLGGTTVLAVEDSRYASEALRLMCLRSGARMRRADCLAAADRHLRCYRPDVVIIDLGLPDGAGETLIAQLAGARSRIPVILGTSGDDAAEARVIKAGADGFLPKPVTSVAAFQHTILPHLRTENAQRPFVISTETVQPDPLAELDDLRHAADLLEGHADAETVDYLLQFLAALATSAEDARLEHVTSDLTQERRKGARAEVLARKLARLLRDRTTDAPITFTRQASGRM
ncbi:response regulator [Actibacterium sp. XHP0104]|uniref:response regulator n=1 Tax=Actibacterium sp. XHP0104 TaxID=2984335 RepID=UPI0021E7B08A|nr:response regulator [Actibacterium sp. XHP0104]MCV2880462.1 response regulator [Actibacterium sp. XHP0104]